MTLFLFARYRNVLKAQVLLSVPMSTQTQAMVAVTRLPQPLSHTTNQLFQEPNLRMLAVKGLKKSRKCQKPNPDEVLEPPPITKKRKRLVTSF